MQRPFQLLTSLVVLTVSACGPRSPHLVVPEQARVEANIQVIDIDPLVIATCQKSVWSALLRHGFQMDDSGSTGMPLPLNVEVSFPDPLTSDITCLLPQIIGPARSVLASSRVGYYDLPPRNARAVGARHKIYTCDIAAERFANALVDELGAASDPPSPQ